MSRAGRRDGARPNTVRRPAHLGDFAVEPRMVLITGWALLVGAVSAGTAWALLRLIGLITNLVFFQRVETDLVAPGGAAHPWILVLLAPAAGGLVVGLMARYGSEKIRGHGMPEAIEAILTGGSRVKPRVAVLKPVSAAVTIGTGGPFGAEGPIIMTGGAVGSLLAQALRLSADERKTLLVAGAAGGMAATFNSPLAALLLAVELLLFEWRPRSFVPVAAAVAIATVVRGFILGTAPIFPVATGGATPGALVDGLAVASGVTGGLLAVAATALVYLAEDAFHRLPVHWMWWPAIGGVVIGLGGLIEPRALGVGYDVIDELLTGRAGLALIAGILTVKTVIWAFSLGSGTSGGVMAPIFMIGGALGALEAHVLPTVFPGFWALLGLGAVVGGVMRSPLTGIVFTLELTHAWSTVLPLMIACCTAYGLSALVLKRSVLTEKIARRGLHLTREYSTDPLEAFFACDVMTPVGERRTEARTGERADGGHLTAAPVVVQDGDTLRQVANVFAQHGITRAPVVSRAEPGAIVGVIRLEDLLHARLHDVTEETHRERHLAFGWPRRGARPTPGATGRRGTGSAPRPRGRGGRGDPGPPLVGHEDGGVRVGRRGSDTRA